MKAWMTDIQGEHRTGMAEINKKLDVLLKRDSARTAALSMLAGAWRLIVIPLIGVIGYLVRPILDALSRLPPTH